MKTAAIYARFSTDQQREQSIEDQVALCRDYAARNGYEIVAVFEDRGITGSSMLLRPGIQGIIQAARTGAFGFVLAESMSRIGRDQEDRAAIRKRLTFVGVGIVTVADGVVAPLVDGIRAVIDSVQLDDLKAATWRGMQGVLRDGRHPGGLAYGYRAVPGQPGVLELLPEQADIIRRIFAEYVAGDTAREIAGRLNAEGIAPPRGQFWRGSTINGNGKRGTGILLNRLYVGEIVWNRARTPRDPDSGERVWRAKPEIEWQRTPAPQLRIVDDLTFAAAGERRIARAFENPRARIRPKRLLSGLLRCGACNAGMSSMGKDHGRPRIVCSQMKEAGRCDNRRHYYLDEIEREVVKGLQDRLGSAAAVRYFVRCYNEERRKANAGTVDRRADVERELAAVERKIARAVAAVIDERITQGEADNHLPALRAERDGLAQRLAALRAPRVIDLRPAAVDAHVRSLGRLHELLAADLAAGHSEAAQVIRSYVETVTVVPAPAPDMPPLKVVGILPLVAGGHGAGCGTHTVPATENMPFLMVLGGRRAA